MKKFIALGGIAAMGTFGFLGLGSTAAFAAGAPGSAQAQICSAATTALNNVTGQLNVDLAVQGNAASANATAQGKVTADVPVYISTAMTYIHDVDNTPAVSPSQKAADLAAFNVASNTTVNDYVAASATNLAKFNADKTVATDTFQQNVFGQLVTAAC